MKSKSLRNVIGLVTVLGMMVSTAIGVSVVNGSDFGVSGISGTSGQTNGPDLVVTSGTITSRTQNKMVYTYTIKNAGKVAISDMSKVSIQHMYSSNTTFNDSGDYIAGGDALSTMPLSLAPGESFTGTYALYSKVLPDRYYLTFKIDSDNAVKETNENNNTYAIRIPPADTSKLPDLVLIHAQIATRTYDGRMTCRYTIQNTGNDTIDNLSRILIKSYYSANTIFNDAGDIDAGHIPINSTRSLAPGEMYTGTYPLYGPIPQGMSYVTIRFDYGNFLIEKNEVNNDNAAWIPPYTLVP